MGLHLSSRLSRFIVLRKLAIQLSLSTCGQVIWTANLSRFWELLLISVAEHNTVVNCITALLLIVPKKYNSNCKYWSYSSNNTSDEFSVPLSSAVIVLNLLKLGKTLPISSYLCNLRWILSCWFSLLYSTAERSFINFSSSFLRNFSLIESKSLFCLKFIPIKSWRNYFFVKMLQQNHQHNKLYN